MPVSLHFTGWYQARLATDPDPYDEPFGIEGAVLSVSGEPPLDRRIRFQPPGCYLRPAITPELVIGVTVVEAPPELGLAGARVELLDDPVFEGRNHLIAGDGTEPIWPIRIRVHNDGAAVERAYADLPVARIPDEAFAWYSAAGEEAQKLLGDHGLPAGDPAEFVSAAKERLTTAAATATEDDRERFGLRAARLDRAALFNRAQMQWRVWLTGQARVTPPGRRSSLDLESPWGLEMLSTGYLYDAMCAVVSGWLHIPTPGDALGQDVWRQPGRP